MPHEPLVPKFHDLSQNWREIDLLVLVQFTAARISSRMNVSENILVFFEASYHVTVHQLHMVDIKQQFDFG